MKLIINVIYVILLLSGTLFSYRAVSEIMRFNWHVYLPFPTFWVDDATLFVGVLGALPVVSIILFMMKWYRYDRIIATLFFGLWMAYASFVMYWVAQK